MLRPDIWEFAVRFRDRWPSDQSSSELALTRWWFAQQRYPHYEELWCSRTADTLVDLYDTDAETFRRFDPPPRLVYLEYALCP